MQLQAKAVLKMNMAVRECLSKTCSQSNLAVSCELGCVSAVTPAPLRGALHLAVGASLCQPPSHTALPRCALTFCTSNAPVFKCISFLFSPETNLSCHFTAGYAVSLLLLFFLCPVILCKCWCVAELSREQIGKIIVSDRYSHHVTSSVWHRYLN